MSSTVKDVVGLVLRLVVGAVLVVAGGIKVDNLGESRQATRAYDLMPVDLANFLGSLLPFVEVALGLMLIIGLLTRAAAIGSALLLLAFIGAIASAWARGLTIDCGCFGGGGQVDSQDTRYLQEILRDGALVIGAIWLVVRPRTRFSLDHRLWGD
ncbi:MauE/DoxX family redox-associated membrane protein [Demetria terragena]|uniref:MauE/DoxX family redox-associated membrane protein n=1 Tax=Demetria terragena TaxID=63959 RepID=UPI000375F16A|nr:MauE/DoxX family redox-associated membrane protein [Demetria terragena]